MKTLMDAKCPQCLHSVYISFVPPSMFVKNDARRSHFSYLILEKICVFMGFEVHIQLLVSTENQSFASAIRIHQTCSIRSRRFWTFLTQQYRILDGNDFLKPRDISKVISYVKKVSNAVLYVCLWGE
uniref:Uncharacterized protein n=1 Tax=Micrurus spixii TaxID=129469 RepID=A0A2D4NES5_9SAUR